MFEQQIPTVPQQPKKPCKNDRKTMLKKQALARYYFQFLIYIFLTNLFFHCFQVNQPERI